MNNGVTIIDVGSSKITAMIGERGVNGTFVVNAVSDAEYDGFAEGKFFSEEEFKNSITNALSSVADADAKVVKEVFVGVPGAFIRIENRKFRLSFGRRKKITAKDVSDLLAAGQKKVYCDGYENIYASGIYFSFDDNRKSVDPVGQQSGSLGGLITYQLCEKYFIDLVRSAVAAITKAEVRFVYSLYAEGKFLLKGLSDTAKLLTDVGYITTDSVIFLGNGIIAKDSVDYGGGYITAALVEKYGLSPSAAEQLKRDVSLGYIRGGQSQYLVDDDGETESFQVEDVNELVRGVLDELAGNIDAFLEENLSKIAISGIYLTGGGVAFTRGATEHLSGRIGQAVEIIAPETPMYNKAIYSSTISLLDFSLDERKQNKLFFIFKRRG